jgi:hypothetical protein
MSYIRPDDPILSMSSILGSSQLETASSPISRADLPPEQNFQSVEDIPDHILEKVLESIDESDLDPYLPPAKDGEQSWLRNGPGDSSTDALY